MSGGAALARLLADPQARWPEAAPQAEALLAVARRAVLLSTLAEVLARRGQLQQVDHAPRQHLLAARRVGERLAHEVRAELGRVAQALDGAGHRVVLLKGAAYLAAGLPPAPGRLFSDIDLIVPQVAIDQAELALLGAGWAPAQSDPYDQRYYREWMHEVPPLRHALRASTIDLHHTITPPTSAFAVDGAELLAAARRLPGPEPLWVLQPVDMVLHSAVHLFTEGEFDHGLRDLWDLHALIGHFEAQEPGFWPKLLARARQLGLTQPLHHALVHVGRLFGTRPPPAQARAVAALAPGPLRRQVMSGLLRTALEPTPRHRRGTAEEGARWLLYVRSHWLRMPPQLLLPHLLRKAWKRRFPDLPEPTPPPAG